MSDNLRDTLKNLKDKLSNLEVNYETKLSHNEKRNRIHESIDKKLEDLVGYQADKVKVEAGGRIYETTKTAILSCIYPNLLKDQLEKSDKSSKDYVYQSVYYQNNQEIKVEQPANVLFVDLDKKSFKL